ncbi:unnamed protein product [Sympodiomycopsis kandeliae]
MSALTGYAPWVAWAVLPSLVSQYALKALHSASIVSRPITQDQARRQGARMQALLVAGYLVYLFCIGIAKQEPSAYQLLGVDLDCNGENIKKAFRKLAMIYHPDKVGPQGERFFIALRRSHDVLSDPVKRFAYDRFGMSVLTWKDAQSYREHVVVGLRQSIMFYIVNPLIFIIISWFQKDGSSSSFWHFSLVFFLVSSELYMITAPDRPQLLKTLLPGHTVNEVILLYHQMYMSLTMAARQLYPLLAPAVGELSTEPRNFKEAQAHIERMTGQMEQIGVLSGGLNAATQRAYIHDLEPLRPQALSTAATLPIAAQTAASGVPANTGQRSSRMEEAYVHLVGQAMLIDALKAGEHYEELRSIQSASLAPDASSKARESQGSAHSRSNGSTKSANVLVEEGKEDGVPSAG